MLIVSLLQQLLLGEISEDDARPDAVSFLLRLAVPMEKEKSVKQQLGDFLMSNHDDINYAAVSRDNKLYIVFGYHERYRVPVHQQMVKAVVQLLRESDGVAAQKQPHS